MENKTHFTVQLFQRQHQLYADYISEQTWDNQPALEIKGPPAYLAWMMEAVNHYHDAMNEIETLQKMVSDPDKRRAEVELYQAAEKVCQMAQEYADKTTEDRSFFFFGVIKLLDTWFQKLKAYQKDFPF